ncbi:Phosphoglycerate dehydrogenase [Abditibacterium utsteinense]|uniref:Phosphoglycerate dehydrogenase n=1 Tax=Abditibacterium utsteinense TaxID=1960156 RepID=A0A2S8ST96_9BACT|nr:D-2-hydroxyacid dehydrogenase [Abditibacterium utsteinense]PQV64023.1 Phosphoglycerate dehydrogenase [Abditibacterium utsteinense]
MNSPTFLLSGRDDAAFPQKIKEIAPHIEIVSPAQFKQNPNLISQIEIAYDGLRGDDLARATSLKWLQNSGAGVDGLPLQQLEERGVLVTNVSGIHARCITEHLFGMLLGVTRELDTARKQQENREWKHLGGDVISLYGKTLGILGAGEIGNQIARAGRAFEMKPIGLRRSGEPTTEIETMFSPENKLEFFAQSEIVMNILPLTDATRGFMGDAEFDALPDGAILLNAGRGATIDTDALGRALQSGKLRAALLDVTDPEPLPPLHFLWNSPNVFITPHYSGAHPEYNDEADAIFFDNLRLYLKGEPLHHLVNFEAGY